MSKHRKGSQALAYTLVELIIVLVVLSLGLGTLMTLMRQVSVNTSASHFLASAEGLAQEKIEETIAAGFSAAAVGSTAESSIANFSDFLRTTTITYTSASDLNGSAGGATNYKRVNVSVSSKSGSFPGTVEVVTLLTDA